MEIKPGDQHWRGIGKSEMDCLQRQFPDVDTRRVMEDPYNNASRIAGCLELDNLTRLAMNPWLRLTGRLSTETSDCVYQATAETSLEDLINTTAKIQTGREGQVNRKERLITNTAGMVLLACMTQKERENTRNRMPRHEELATLCTVAALGGARNFLQNMERMGEQAETQLARQLEICRDRYPEEQYPTPKTPQECNGILMEQLAGGTARKDAQGVRTEILSIQQSNTGCEPESWNPMPTDLKEESGTNGQGCNPPIQLVPQGLRDPEGKLRRDSAKDESGNIIIHWRPETAPVPGELCWLYNGEWSRYPGEGGPAEARPLSLCDQELLGQLPVTQEDATVQHIGIVIDVVQNIHEGCSTRQWNPRAYTLQQDPENPPVCGPQESRTETGPDEEGKHEIAVIRWDPDEHGALRERCWILDLGTQRWMQLH